MNPVKHSQKNWRFCLENSGGDLLGAGLDIDAQGHKQVAPSLEIGLEPGQNSPGTSAWNLPPGFLRVDGKGHFKFQNGAGLDGPPFAQRPTRKLARKRAPAHRVPARRRCPSKGLSPTILPHFLQRAGLMPCRAKRTGLPLGGMAIFGLLASETSSARGEMVPPARPV